MTKKTKTFKVKIIEETYHEQETNNEMIGEDTSIFETTVVPYSKTTKKGLIEDRCYSIRLSTSKKSSLWVTLYESGAITIDEYHNFDVLTQEDMETGTISFIPRK